MITVLTQVINAGVIISEIFHHVKTVPLTYAVKLLVCLPSIQDS